MRSGKAYGLMAATGAVLASPLRKGAANHMKILKIILGMLLLLPITTSQVSADSDIINAVATQYFDRIEDAGLHAIAHQRAIEIVSDWSHNQRRGWTAEVLAQNFGVIDPATQVVTQWLGSPDHHNILSDPYWTHIGCASHVENGIYYAACVLTHVEPITVVVPTVPKPILVPVLTPVYPVPVILLPNTAMNYLGGSECLYIR